jgi:hypothetical protein
MDVQMPDGTIVTGVPDDITQKDLMSRYQNYQPPAAQSREGIRSVLPETSNPVYGLISRGAGIVGSGLEAVQRAGDYLATGVASALPFTSFTREQAEQVSRPQFVGRAAEATKAYSEGINYAPSTTLGELGDNPLKVIPFIAERIITSTPDMAAAVFAAPAYITARTNEILNERLKNDEKELKDATVSDVAASLVGAVIEQKLESFATKGLFKGRKLTGKNAGTRILKEMGVQSGTEGLEEAAANIAGSLGTKRGVDPRELGENVLEGMIVGAGLGGGVRGTQEYLQSRKKPEEDFTEPKTIIDPETGIKRVYSYTPIDDPSLELGGTPDINGRKTYIYREKPLETEQETTEIAPPAAPPATIPAAPPVTPPVAPASQEGVPSDVGVDRAAMEEEFLRSQGQLPAVEPVSEPVAQPAQVAQTGNVQVTPPGEPVSAPPAAPTAQVAQTTPAEGVQVTPPVEPAPAAEQATQTTPAGNVQTSAEDIVPLNDKGEPTETPQSISEPTTEVGQDVSQVDAPESATIKATDLTTSEDGYIADKSGNPMALYHSTRAVDESGNQIKELIPGGPKGTGSGKAIWFGIDPNALQAAHNAPVGKSGTYTIPAYVKIKNPLYIDDFNYEEMRDRWGPDLPFSISDERIAKLKDAGFDGIIYEDNGKIDEVIVFDKDQITFKSDYKSALKGQTEAESKAEQDVAEDDLSVQNDVVSTPVQISPEQQKIGALNKFEKALLNPVPSFQAVRATGTSVLKPRPLNAKQVALLKDLASEAIDLGMPASLLENISAAGAARINAVAAIASRKGWLVLGGDWSSSSRAEKLQAIIHELGHSIDNAKVSGLKVSISESDAWQDAYDELKYWHDVSDAKKEHPLSYPFDKQFIGKVNLKRESFAQAFAYYFVSPVDLQTNAPEAYSQIQSIVEGIQNESQRAGAAGAAKTGATEVKVQQPRTQESAAVQSDAGKVGSGVRESERSKDRDDQSIKDEAGNAPQNLTGQKDISKIAEKADVPPILQAPADFVLKKGRIEQVVLAARALEDGKITKAEYDKYVDYYAPIATVGTPEAPLSEEGMKRVLKSNQVDKINPKVKDGTRVGLRMDINALKRAQQLSAQTGNKINGSVVSIHEGSTKAKTGKIIGYSGAASIKNARFEIRSEQAAFEIAQGVDDKSPQQTIEGEWVNISPEEAYSRVQSLLKDPAWSQVSLDPLRHSFFYDRSNKQPVVSADEILQVGRFVLAKNVKYAEREEFLYSQLPKKPAATWQSLEPMTWKDTRAIQLFDKHRNLDLVQKEITKIVGEISNELNAYRAETLAHGRAEREWKDFMSKEFRPIINEMKANNVTDENLTEYLVMRHAEEANDLIAERNPNDPSKQDKGSGVSYKQREDYFKDLDPAKKKVFESLAKKVDVVLAKTRDLLEEGGVITKEQRDAWESLFKFYVPLRREESDYSLPSSSYRRVGDYAKSRTGSAKDVIDVLSNVAAAREIAIYRIEKERVNRAVYGLSVMNPNPEYWMAISPDAIKNKDVLIAELEDKFDLSKQDAEAFVKNIMAEPTKERFNKETGVVDRYIDTTAKYADYVLPVKIDGKDRFVFFNPKNDRSMQMVQSLRGLDVPKLGSVMQTIAPITRFFSAINTQYNLIFGAWNFARDVQGARLNLSTTPIADEKNAVLSGTFAAIPDIYKAVREQTKDKPFSDTGDGSWDDFTRHGGKVGYKDQFAKLNQSTNIVNRELATLDRGITMRGAYKVLNYISDVNDVLENATRLSAYRVALDKFKKEAAEAKERKKTDPKVYVEPLDSMKARAADIAKNITVNFNRKGTWGVTAGSLYAFFNASAQGTKRLYETLTGPKGKTIMAAGIGIGIAQAIALAMAGFDEDEPTEFIKQKNLIIPTGDGKYVMWPMPFGFNVFPNLGRIFFETASKASKGQSVTPQLANTVTMLANAFNPLGGGGLLQMVTPTVGDPIVALIENKDAFGRPISRESRATSPEPGYKLSRDPSPSISQFLAEFINTITFGNKDKRGFLSPTADQMDYLGKQLGGGVYREASGILTWVSNEAQDKETPDYKVPIVGKIVGDLNSPPAISQRFYSNVIKMAEHEKAIKGRIDRRENVTTYMRENPEASMWRRANTLENEISKLNRRRREMVEKQEPVERIKKLDDQKTRMMKQFNDQVRKYN